MERRVLDSATVTGKNFQVCLVKSVRNLLGVGKGDKIQYVLNEQGRIEIEKKDGAKE